MNYLALSLPMRIPYTPNKLSEPPKINTIVKKISTFCLGIILAIAVMPLLIALKLVSQFVPQQQWEGFWDSFIEDSLKY